METNKLQWKRIARGENLPCASLLMKYDGTIPSVISCAGVEVGQDAYYLPVDELRTLPKEESEDEKVRKSLIDFFSDSHASDDFKGIPFDRIVAWLEKQGGIQKNIAFAYQEGYDDGLRVNLEMQGEQPKDVTYTHEVKTGNGNIKALITEKVQLQKKYEKQGEQKPVESDEEFDAFVRWFVRQRTDNYTLIPSDETVHQWAEMILEHARKVKQKPAEWSEEDEKGLGDALWCCNQAASIAKDENDMGNCWYAEHWLKSLRPQKQWKPSDEQINALAKNVEYVNVSCTQPILKGLLEDLKKLREE